MNAPFIIVFYSNIILGKELRGIFYKKLPERKSGMLIFLLFFIMVITLVFLNIKLGVYQSPARLSNFEKFTERIKWRLIARWGP